MKRLMGAVVFAGSVCAAASCIQAQTKTDLVKDATENPQSVSTAPLAEVQKQFGTPTDAARQDAVIEKKLQKDSTIISGTVREMANDKSYIVIEGTKILTSPEFIEETYVEVGDKVRISVVKTPQGLKAEECSYVFDEMPNAMEQEALTETSQNVLPKPDDTAIPQDLNQQQ